MGRPMEGRESASAVNVPEDVERSTLLRVVQFQARARPSQCIVTIDLGPCSLFKFAHLLVQKEVLVGSKLVYRK